MKAIDVAGVSAEPLHNGVRLNGVSSTANYLLFDQDSPETKIAVGKFSFLTSEVEQPPRRVVVETALQFLLFLFD